MSANYKKLGDYIQPVDIRNSDLQISHLLGRDADVEMIHRDNFCLAQPYVSEAFGNERYNKSPNGR